MKDWSFAKRVGVGFTAVILLVFALGGFSYSRLVSIRTASDHITRQTTPTVELCRRVQINVKDSVQLCYKHIGSTSSQDMADLETQLKAGSVDNNAAYAALEKLLPSGEGHERLLRTEKAREEYNKLRDQVLAVSRQATNNVAAYQLARTQLDPAGDCYIGAINALIELSQTEAAVAAKDIQSAVGSSIWGMLLGSILSVLVGGSVGGLIVIGTSQLLKGVATQLEQSSEQLAAASNQVSAASQSLAEGSSEQAASIEETSSSLEEMSSMTQRNAENAQKANELAREARTAADAGAADMQAMNQAMQEIKAASDEIGKIIKTIDEIAFQTNILALNAAVEAARAGEAGMGFAVVADEVRNLAQRCAQSAKETADKIEGAITKTSQGVEISTKVTQGLQEIVAKVRQVDELVAEVASASKEQSQGISQVNTAVTQMDKVTQSNAANAEESASAAEELNAQAESLKEAVNQLMELVGGQNGPAGAPLKAGHRPRPAAARTVADSILPMPVPAAASRPRARLESTPPRVPQLPAPHAPASLIEWDPARMSTGVEQVDSQHQELIVRINRLHAACLAGAGRSEVLDLLTFLGEYAQTHFRDEERLMKEQACPTYGANKAAHAQFLREYKRLHALVSREGATTSTLLALQRMLGEWLQHHICTVDTGLRESVCQAE